MKRHVLRLQRPGHSTQWDVLHAPPLVAPPVFAQQTLLGASWAWQETQLGTGLCEVEGFPFKARSVELTPVDGNGATSSGDKTTTQGGESIKTK